MTSGLDYEGNTHYIDLIRKQGFFSEKTGVELVVPIGKAFQTFGP